MLNTKSVRIKREKEKHQNRIIKLFIISEKLKTKKSKRKRKKNIVEIMAKLCSNNNGLAHRTSRLFEYIYIFVFACAIVISEVGAHIDFDDIELAWLKNVTVTWLPAGKNQRQNWLQIVGLPPMENEDDLKIRPTFSSTDCVSNETNLQILNSIPTANNRSTELIVSMGDFDFKRRPAAYLCIQTKYETFFQHMGNRSKLEK